MTKILLNLLIALSIFSCSSRREQQQAKEELVIKSADLTELSELLVAEQRNLPPENSKPKLRKKTVSFNALTPTPCNIKVVLYAYENIDSLSIEAIDMFLNVFSEECNSNVEFSEFSQDMIFEVFGKYPQEVVELITKNDYNLVAITSELESPLLDPLITPIIADFKSTAIKNHKIDSILAALERGDRYLNGE